MRHVEFFDRAHFEENYFRHYPAGKLADFIDFFWQTRFEEVFKTAPAGFSDALFPNTGYSYLVNLGTPYVMLVGEKKFPIRGDSFLPRHQRIECFHKAGNKIFGIKFRLSPVLLEKKVDFSEYRKEMGSLSYLINKQVLDGLKAREDFFDRVEWLTRHFNGIIERGIEDQHPVSAVSGILRNCFQKNDFEKSIETLAAENGISSRTLQRYFERATSLSSKKTLQLMRIRKAVEGLVRDREDWHWSSFGYYDYSHFYKHLVQFMGKDDATKLLSWKEKNNPRVAGVEK